MLLNQNKSKPAPISLINKRTSISQGPLTGINVKPKPTEKEEEERRLKREKMKEKLGNSQKKLLAINKEKENKIEEEKINNQNNHENVSVKIKSFANMFEGKIGYGNSVQKVNSNSNENQKKENNIMDMSEKLKKLYGENANDLKEVELEVDDDENENEKQNEGNNLNSKFKNAIISVKRRITVTKYSSDINEKIVTETVKKNSLIEEKKPTISSHVKKFKKPDFKLDK